MIFTPETGVCVMCVTESSQSHPQSFSKLNCCVLRFLNPTVPFFSRVSHKCTFYKSTHDLSLNLLRHNSPDPVRLVYLHLYMTLKVSFSVMRWITTPKASDQAPVFYAMGVRMCCQFTSEATRMLTKWTSFQFELFKHSRECNGNGLYLSFLLIEDFVI